MRVRAALSAAILSVMYATLSLMIAERVQRRRELDEQIAACKHDVSRAALIDMRNDAEDQERGLRAQLASTPEQRALVASWRMRGKPARKERFPPGLFVFTPTSMTFQPLPGPQGAA